jgi:hypothetical protein
VLSFPAITPTQEHLIADIAGAARGEGAVAKQGNSRLRRLTLRQLREEVAQLKKECEEQRARKVGLNEDSANLSEGGQGWTGAEGTPGNWGTVAKSTRLSEHRRGGAQHHASQTISSVAPSLGTVNQSTCWLACGFTRAAVLAGVRHLLARLM